MNLEEAIRIVDPATRREALYIYDPEERESVENEARHMVVESLREQQKIHSNDPLTLEELRKMDGEPVWLVTYLRSEYCIVHRGEWCLIHSHHADDVIGGGIIMVKKTAEKRGYPYTDYGKTWLAYCRKPEEGEIK